MRVEEESVRSPRERLVAPVEIRIVRRLRKVTVVLCSQVVHMLGVVVLGVANPKGASDDWTQVDVRLKERSDRNERVRTCRNSNEVTSRFGPNINKWTSRNIEDLLT